MNWIQARISLRAGGAAAQGPARGGVGFEDFLYIFFAGIKNFACGAIFWLAISQKFCYRAIFPKNFACGAV
jgi:hypothetical protein